MVDYLVYGFSGGKCRYCDMAINLLEKNGVEYIFHNIQEQELMDELKERRGMTSLKGQTVPQIFKLDSDNNYNYIGGYTELNEQLL